MNNIQRITIEPGKRGGQPCIRGMRFLRQGMDLWKFYD
ncbi:MAG: DUF433 domain-containing protein [Acidithiobacillus ferrivorans]